MDLKKMLLELAQAQADKMQEEAVGWLGSDEFADQIATKINEKIDSKRFEKFSFSVGQVYNFNRNSLS